MDDSQTLLSAGSDNNQPAPTEGSLMGSLPTEGQANSESPKGGAEVAGQQVDQKPGEATQQKQPDPKAASAPEQYADFKLPEGTQYDKAAADQFKAVAKSMNLSQEAAQKLVDLQAGFAQSQIESQMAAYKAQISEWRNETIKELGANYEKELRFAAKARDKFGSPELTKILDESGLGNRKEVVSLFMKIGRAISEDSFVDGKSGPARSQDAASVLYPSHTSN